MTHTFPNHLEVVVHFDSGLRETILAGEVLRADADAADRPVAEHHAYLRALAQLASRPMIARASYVRGVEDALDAYFDGSPYGAGDRISELLNSSES